jgi:hypothetical protein
VTTFVSASHATKYAVASTSGESRFWVAATVTGICTLAARDSSAGERPLREIPGESRELAQFLESDLQLVRRRLKEPVHLGIAASPSRRWAPRARAQRDEALLGAVVETLDPAPLVVSCGDDPRTRLRPSRAALEPRHGAGR